MVYYKKKNQTINYQFSDAYNNDGGEHLNTSERESNVVDQEEWKRLL